MTWNHDMGWGGWGLLSFGTVAFWALIIWLVVAVVRDKNSGKEGSELKPPTNSAERILAERYARGEIDTDEYRRRVEDSRGGHLSGTRP